MLQAPRIVTEIPGPKSRELVAREAKHLAPGTQSISGLSGIAVQRNVGSVIEDVDGNRFLDFAAGICVNALGGTLWPLLVIGVASIPTGMWVFGRVERYAKRTGKLKRSG